MYHVTLRSSRFGKIIHFWILIYRLTLFQNILNMVTNALFDFIFLFFLTFQIGGSVLE